MGWSLSEKVNSICKMRGNLLFYSRPRIFFADLLQILSMCVIMYKNKCRICIVIPNLFCSIDKYMKEVYDMGYSGYSGGGDIGGSNNSGGYSSADSYGGFYNSNTGYTSADSYGGYYNSNTGYTSRDSYGGYYNSNTGYSSKDSYGGYYNSSTGYTSQDSYGGSYNSGGGK